MWSFGGEREKPVKGRRVKGEAVGGCEYDQRTLYARMKI